MSSVMRRASSLLLVLFFPWGALRAEAPVDRQVSDWFASEAKLLMDIYQDLHRHPELSLEEKQTAAKLADLWEAAGYQVTRNVGGHGIVGILENGSGPTVMLRTDLDGLPIKEQTGLEYASTQTASKADGTKTPVMHACGHDVHMTNLTAVARYLASHRDQWSGTIMLVGQPAEEIGEGAKAMLGDGLFERFTQPDFALAIHVASDTVSGTIGYRAGYSQANVDSVDITMHGRSGHGSKPELTIDPIMQAAELVVSLQTIVSREIAPIQPAVVTVGSIHGGSKHNIIGDDCKLQLTVRSYDTSVRAHLLEAIQRKANAVAMGARAPKPTVLISQGTPSLFNNEELTHRITGVFSKLLGSDRMIAKQPSMGGEDFSRYGQAGVPIFMYSVGSVPPRVMDIAEKTGVPPPSLHSSKYAPEIEVTLQTAIRTMIAAVLELAQEENGSQR